MGNGFYSNSFIFFGDNRDVGGLVIMLKIVVLSIFSVVVFAVLWYLAGSADKDEIKDDDFNGYGL